MTNSVQLHEIVFQPMPKRFMVWDKSLSKFYAGSEGKACVFDIWSLIEFLNNSQRCPEQLEIVQSTNLFDEDGEEIFEGSVVRDFDEVIGVVYYDIEEGGYWVKAANGDTWQLAETSEMKVLGHILSNPELSEAS